MLYFVPRTFPAMPTCWAPGCKSGYRTASDDAKVKRHFFHVPPHNVELWSRRIPRDGVLSVRNYICDIHFESRIWLRHNLVRRAEKETGRISSQRTQRCINVRRNSNNEE